MLQELLNRLNAVANGAMSMDALEEWLVGHLQFVLDSGDDTAVALANEIDGLLVERSEGLVSDWDVLMAVNRAVRERSTVIIPADSPTPAETGSSLIATIALNLDLRPVVDLHLQHRFA